MVSMEAPQYTRKNYTLEYINIGYAGVVVDMHSFRLHG